MHIPILPVLDKHFVVLWPGRAPMECLLVEVNDQVEITELGDGVIRITIGAYDFERLFASERLGSHEIRSLLISTQSSAIQTSIMGCSTIGPIDPRMERPLVARRDRTVLFI